MQNRIQSPGHPRTLVHIQSLPQTQVRIRNCFHSSSNSKDMSGKYSGFTSSGGSVAELLSVNTDLSGHPLQPGRYASGPAVLPE